MKIFILLAFASQALGNPYPYEWEVPKDDAWKQVDKVSAKVIHPVGQEVLRVEVGWEPETDSFFVRHVSRERSGTPALQVRSKHQDTLGSYHGILFDPSTGEQIAFDSIGTGSEYRHLTRSLTFRFPVPDKPMGFRLIGEDGVSGESREMLSAWVDAASAPWVVSTDVEVRELKQSNYEPSIRVVFYADGYLKPDAFWGHAQKAIEGLEKSDFPSHEYFSYFAAYAPSNRTLGSAQDLGPEIVNFDTFLGLYFPYWHKFGRWYHIVYPTREKKYRDGLAQVPYDYPVVLMDSSAYWGVGNYNELTAVPSRSYSFTYLLLHEFGHYFGLNEEYESGGSTELAFAPNINEPWSQNITFHPSKDELKWKHLIKDDTPLPTPNHYWTSGGPYGAYRGGYAQTPSLQPSHKPGRACVMSSGGKFCPICKHAIDAKIAFDLGGLKRGVKSH